MAEFVEAVGYKPEGLGFDSGWGHWDFSVTSSYWPHYCPGVNSSSNRNGNREHLLGGKGGRYVGLRTSPPLCAVCQSPTAQRACPGLYRDCFSFVNRIYLSTQNRVACRRVRILFYLRLACAFQRVLAVKELSEGSLSQFLFSETFAWALKC